jgi:SagB-type dehydrogenase family enzyme
MDGEVARRYHRETSFGPRHWPRSDVAGFTPMDPRNRPRPFKRYPQAPVHDLPEDLPVGGAAAVDALSGRVPRTDPVVDRDLLARLLFYSAGVTRVAGPPADASWFRAAPSAGNLHPLEVYVVAGAMPGLDPGLYHFAPDVFGLEELSRGECRPAVADAVAAPEVAASQFVLVVTGIPWRTGWKYGERGLRHVYWDAGAVLANFLAVAQAHGLRAHLLLGFVDSALSRHLGIDGVDEFPVAVATVGLPDDPRTPVDCTSAGLAPTPLSPDPIEFPLITSAQWAGNLDTEDQVVAWRATAPAGLPRAQDEVDPPASGCASTGAEPIESVILRRGSTRRMRRGVVPADLLHWAMAVATRHVPADALPAGGTLLVHELAIHAVNGMQPGLYHWAEGAPQPYQVGPESAVRRLTRGLCLDQALGGDSGYTDFACADLDRVLDGYGDRGYRVAQFEAGVAAERLQLAGFALDHGGTGLTFSDEEVAAAFGTSAACMLAVSIGIPAYRARPGGPPGRPTQLA